MWREAAQAKTQTLIYLCKPTFTFASGKTGQKAIPGRTQTGPTGNRLDRNCGHFAFFAAALQQRFAAGSALATGAAFLQQHFLAAGLSAALAQHFFAVVFFTTAFLAGTFFVVAIDLILLV